MLSVKAISKNQNIQYYFEKDNNYYVKEDQEHLIAAFDWHGKGAKLFGLSGQVLLKDFEQVMQGITPEGVPLGLKKGETFLHRPGFDLTFSAPKSVSILALIGGDDRLIHLHQKAVRIALDVVEREAQARITVKGETTYHATRNLMMAQFLHDTSRAGDPQLHTHAVIANMTMCEDGKWRSLASDISRQNGFFERVMNNHTYYGLIYRTELAKGLTEMGYEIDVINQHGLFEIKAVPEPVLKTFSKRRHQIETAMEAMGYDSFKAYDKSALDTRQSKKTIDRDTLLAEWLKEMKDTGWDMADFQQQAHEKVLAEAEKTAMEEKNGPEYAENTPVLSALARQTVKDAITTLSQGALSLDYTQVIRRSAEYSLGRCRHEELTQAFENLVHEKIVIPLDKKGIVFATHAQVQTEIALMNAVEKGKKAYCSMRIKDNLLEKRGISPENQTILKHLLGCQDRIVQLNYATENKHEFLSQLLNTVEDHGKSVKILLPNAMHANDAKENIQRSSTTCWQWIKKFNKDPVAKSVDTVAGFTFKAERNSGNRFEKGILLVDGAQKLSPEAMNALFAVAEKSKTKIILLNETEGIHYAHQSSVMKTLEKAKIKTQTQAIKAEKPTFHLTLHAIEEDDVRLTAVANDYVQLPEKEQLNTLVVGQSLREARQLNGIIRNGLKNKGQLGRQEQVINTYQSVFLSDTERQYAKHYTNTMVIRTFNDHAVEELKILTVLPEENSVIVRHANGKKERMACKKLPKNSQLFEEKKLAVSEQEKLMITGNMKKMGLSKGEIWTVKKINTRFVILEKKTAKENQTLTLSLNDLEKSQIDYHYAEALSQCREGKVGRILTSLKSRAINKESLHALSRQSGEVVLYTNHAKKAESRLNVIPDRITVIDHIFYAHESQTHQKILNADTLPTLQTQLTDAIQNLNVSVKNPMDEAMDFAIAQLSERNAGFKHQELMETAITYALGAVTVEDLEDNLREKLKSGVLLAGRDEDNQTLWTTLEALTMEKEILSGLQRGKNTQKSLMCPELLTAALEKTTLTAGQKEACYLIGTTRDRFVMVQGYAGTGKSTTLGKLAQLLKEMPWGKDGEPVKILACAPTHQAVKELAQLGIEAQTIKSLLIDNEDITQDFSNTLLLLDEDSMEGNRDIHAFQSMVEKNGGRAVYVGDKDQFLSVESGKPKENALNSGLIDVAYMKDIVRQENETVKEAVLNIIQEDVAGALAKIADLDPKMVPREKNVFNEAWLNTINGFETSVLSAGVPRKNEKGEVIKADSHKTWDIAMPLPTAVATEYLSRTQAVRDETAIIVQTHQDRALVHDAIIAGLIELGEIEATGIETHRLVSKRLTRVEVRHIRSYESGDFIKIGKGDYCQVLAVKKDSQQLICKKPDGTQAIIFPHKVSENMPIEVYLQEKALLTRGMRVKMTKTDKDRKILANREWYVKEVSIDSVQLKEKDSERLLNIDPKDLNDQHWDYAYTSTGYGIQGSSYRYVIDFAASYLKHLTNRRAFYITVSRAKLHIMLFTDDKKALLEKFFNRGDKYAALEVVGEIKKSPNRLKKTLPRQEKIPKNAEKQAEISLKKTPEIAQSMEDDTVWRSLVAPHEVHPIDNSMTEKVDKNVEELPVISSPVEAKNLKETPLKVSPAVSVAEKNTSNTAIQAPHKTPALPQKPYFYAKSVEMKLRTQAETVLSTLLGERNRSSTMKAWKYGSNTKQGSLTVTMQGDKQGLWYDFSTQEGGGMLKLIEKQLGLNFKEALEYGAYLVGESPTTAYPSKGNTPHVSKEKTAVKKENKTLETALKLVKESRSISGTLAEKYLKNTRKIEEIPPDNLRFLPQAYTGSINNKLKKYAPALLSIARDNEGKVQSVQLTYLDSKTLNKADLPIKKRNYGSLDGASVLLQKGKDTSITYLAEGTETGLSVANAKPDSRVLVTLGKANFSKMDPNLLTKKVVFCLDNDGYHTFTQSLSHAAEKLKKQGKEVSFVMAETVKNDLNDVLKSGGVSAVNRVLDKEISAQTFHALAEKSESFIQQERKIQQVEKQQKNQKDAPHLTIDAFKEKAETDFAKTIHALYSIDKKSINHHEKPITMNKCLPTDVAQSIRDLEKKEDLFLIKNAEKIKKSVKKKEAISKNKTKKEYELSL